MIFFIKSATVNISKYTIKDIPGSTGRLDVMSRCILSALMADNNFEENIQIWIFLDNYGTLIFDTNNLNYETFPKNELLLTEYIVNLIKTSKLEKADINEKIKYFLEKEYEIYVLKEDGADFFKHLNDLRNKNKLIFIIGNQSGEFIDSKEFTELNIPGLSLGSQSYLASSIIRLIKLNLLTNI